MTNPPASAASWFPDKPVTLVIFSLTYLGIAMGHVPGLKLNRVGIVMLGTIGLMIFGGLGAREIVSYINWPTMFLLFAFFVISAQLRLSGFYDLVARGIVSGLDHPARFLLTLMLATGGLSAFLNHDIVCFVFTPIVGAALLQKGLNPVPFLIALAIASNLGAAATLIGNPQDMMIGQVAHLNFGSYLLWSAVPVAVAMFAAYAIIWNLSANRLRTTLPKPGPSTGSHPFNRAHTIKGIAILALVVGLFFTSLPKEIIALAAAGIHLASTRFRTEDLLALVDWPILVLFMGLFAVAGAFQTTGYGEHALQWLAHAGVRLESTPVLAVVTAALSNLINNSAAVMLLIKVANVTQPPAAYVLALANSFGGSLLILGSVSNIIVVQQARELGIHIGFRDFARLGIPVTLASLAGLIVWVFAAR